MKKRRWIQPEGLLLDVPEDVLRVIQMYINEEKLKIKQEREEKRKQKGLMIMKLRKEKAAEVTQHQEVWKMKHKRKRVKGGTKGIGEELKKKLTIPFVVAISVTFFTTCICFFFFLIVLF